MLTDERLAEIEARAAREPGMHSGCSDYACYCHFAVPELVAEIRRLRSLTGAGPATPAEEWDAGDYFEAARHGIEPPLARAQPAGLVG
jgi:hypothetical protein